MEESTKTNSNRKCCWKSWFKWTIHRYFPLLLLNSWDSFMHRKFFEACCMKWLWQHNEGNLLIVCGHWILQPFLSSNCNLYHMEMSLIAPPKCCWKVLVPTKFEILKKKKLTQCLWTPFRWIKNMTWLQKNCAWRMEVGYCKRWSRSISE
jgi:hypothetical protein